MSDSGQPAPSEGDRGSTPRNRRREAARQKAQLARRREKRRARGLRWAIQGAIALVLIAAIVVVAVVIHASSTQTTASRSPRNMPGDGITIGHDFRAVRAGSSAVTSSPAPQSTAKADTVSIVVYSDFLCPFCGQFERADTSYIRGLVRSGAATVTFHPIAILNSQSQTTKYSQRAANAAACVADQSPDSYFDVNSALFERQPAEGTPGLTNEQLSKIVTGVSGLQHASRIESCITDGTFDDWVTDATQRALSGPIPAASIDRVKGTPTILVNGQLYKYSTPFTTSEFRNFVVTAAGNSYTDIATATPTPTPLRGSTPKPGQTKIGTPAP